MAGPPAGPSRGPSDGPPRPRSAPVPPYGLTFAALAARRARPRLFAPSSPARTTPLARGR